MLQSLARGLAYIFKFDPNQKRAPAGTGNGGQWVKDGGTAPLGHAHNDPSKIKSTTTEVKPRNIRTILTDWSGNRPGAWSKFQEAARHLIGDFDHDTWSKTHTEESENDPGVQEYMRDHHIGPITDEQYSADAKKLLAAIEKSKPLGFPLFRGVHSSDSASSLKVGDEFSESLAGWTSKEVWAEKFAVNRYGTAPGDYGATGKDVVFMMKGSSMKGLSVSRYAEAGTPFKDVDEYLTSGHYKVTNIYNVDKSGNAIITGNTDGMGNTQVAHTKVVEVERVGPAKKDKIVKGEGLAHVFKFNLNHEPAGSAKGGQFAKSLSNMVADRLAAGEHVDLKAKDLAEVVSAMADRKDHPNIMPLHVEGTHMLGGDGLGIPRADMPQIPQAMRKEFLDGLHVQVEETGLDPFVLKPVQDQLDGMKVGNLYKKMMAGTVSPEPIIVSQDNYIIDGHHHWAAKVVMRASDPKVTVQAYKVHMQHGALMDAAQKFTDANNIPRKDITKAEGLAHVFKFNANHEPAGSGKGGQFAKASGAGSATGDVEPSLKPVRVAVPKVITDAIEKQASDMGGAKDQNDAAKITSYINEHYNKELQEMMDAVHTDHRPTIMLHEGSVEKGIPTIWLLGWSNREGTDIHDHVGSAAAITVVRGRVDERAFAFKTKDGEEEVKQSKTKEGLDVASTLRTLHSGSTVTIGAPYVHEMHGESGNLKQRDITVHGYFPPLDKMHYFVHHKDSNNLFYDGMWDEHGKPDIKVRKGQYICGCGYASVFKFNPNHEPAGSSTGGQFAKANSGGGAAGGDDVSLTQYAKEDHDKNVKDSDILDRFTPDERKEIRYAIVKAENSPSSVTLYTHDGVYTEERQALHQQIIDSYTNEDAIKKATPQDGNPTFVVLGGRGGSGKSAFTNGTLKEFDASKFIKIDSDDIKGRLRPPYEGWNAATVHAEAAELVETIRSVLLARGANVVLDATLKSRNVERDIQQAKANGYRIEGHYMYVDRTTAAIRSTKRYLGKDPQHRGRLVPVDVILANKENESNFDYMKKYFDSWSAYDNTGKSPTLIGRGGK
jgi:predicted ABC-type ATPase